jgi:hypothetical protein
MQTSSNMLSLLILAIPTILLFAWTVWQQITISQMKKRQKMIFSGKNKVDLEQLILECKEQNKKTASDTDKLYKITNELNTLANKSLHKFSVIRFNPFRDIGGDQSFSVAMLDNSNNGVIISSLYSRDGVRVYAKSIQNGVCEKYQLTEEEKHAIALAANRK